MAFGGASVPDGYMVRTFRVKVMATKGQQNRCFELLEDAGDAWAWCIDRFHERIKKGLPAANSVTQLWPHQKAHGPFGDLTAHCAQDVTKAWSSAFFASMRRRKRGERARLPLKKRHLVPVTWRKGEFTLAPATETSRAHVVLFTRREAKNLSLSLSHDHPYDPALVRAVRLVEEADELFLDITAWAAVTSAHKHAQLVGGVDPGVIHPLVVAGGGAALVVSGRASRAEEFLHSRTKKFASTRCLRRGLQRGQSGRLAHGAGRPSLDDRKRPKPGTAGS